MASVTLNETALAARLARNEKREGICKIVIDQSPMAKALRMKREGLARLVPQDRNEADRKDR